MENAYRLMRPESEAWVMRGLRVLVGGPEKLPGVPVKGRVNEITEKVDGFLAYAQTAQVDIRRQVVALKKGAGDEELIAGMCLWVPSPGKTAMLFAPAMSTFPESATATQKALSAGLDDARAAGVVLAQAMLEPADAAGKTVFAAAGMSPLATLIYMERKPPSKPPDYVLPAGLSLVPYETATRDLFRDAILKSYHGTLDCPALSEMRNVEDVLEGHRSVGRFDPQMWSVLMRGDTPIGCLLLAEIPARRGLELVYLGLAPEGRGQGLGKVLVLRTLAIATRRNFEVATLAVDAENGPAMRLYRRCGYTSVAKRVAMIRRLNSR
jgi:ribosomal protein S18 acetylase RimI-like enzyme